MLHCMRLVYSSSSSGVSNLNVPGEYDFTSGAAQAGGGGRVREVGRCWELRTRETIRQATTVVPLYIGGVQVTAAGQVYWMDLGIAVAVLNNTICPRRHH